jgi:hypothetical protein
MQVVAAVVAAAERNRLREILSLSVMALGFPSFTRRSKLRDGMANDKPLEKLLEVYTGSASNSDGLAQPAEDPWSRRARPASAAFGNPVFADCPVLPSLGTIARSSEMVTLNWLGVFRRLNFIA